MEEEDGEGADTDMERGQLLSLSALSSDSLPAVTAAVGDIALQPVSKLQEGEHQVSDTMQSLEKSPQYDAEATKAAATQ